MIWILDLTVKHSKIKSGKAKEDAQVEKEINEETGNLEILIKDVEVDSKATKGLNDQEFCAMLKLENDAGEEIDTSNAWCSYEESKDENGKRQTKVTIEGLDDADK